MDRRKQTTYQRRATTYGGRAQTLAFTPAQHVQAEQTTPTKKRRKFMWTKRSLLLVIGLAILFVGGGATYAQLGPSLTQSSTTGANLQKGLIGWWKMDNNLRDSSVGRITGTANSLTGTTDRKGVANGAYSFSSVSNSRASMGATTAYLMGTQDWSISAWAKTSTVADQVIISKRNGGPINGYQLNVNANGTVSAFFMVIALAIIAQ